MIIQLLFFTFLSTFYSGVFGQNSQVPDGLIPTQMDLNSGWTPLFFNMTKSPWIGNVYQIEAPVPVKVLYSDAFCPGKMVSIYVNGSFLMNSTKVPLNSGTCDPKIVLPAGTFAFPEIFSHANFSLPIGTHEIALKVIQNDLNLPTGIMYMRSYLPINISCKNQDD